MFAPSEPAPLVLPDAVVLAVLAAEVAVEDTLAVEPALEAVELPDAAVLEAEGVAVRVIPCTQTVNTVGQVWRRRKGRTTARQRA